MLDVNWPCADTSPANVLLSAAAVALASKTRTTPIPLDGVHRIVIAVGQRALELLIVQRAGQVDREGIPRLALTPHGSLELHLPSRDLSSGGCSATTRRVAARRPSSMSRRCINARR